jgi:hypothetical protein
MTTFWTMAGGGKDVLEVEAEGATEFRREQGDDRPRDQYYLWLREECPFRSL